MIPSCLIPLFSTLIIVCNLSLAPVQEVYEPDPAEVTAPTIIPADKEGE